MESLTSPHANRDKRFILLFLGRFIPRLVKHDEPKEFAGTKKTAGKRCLYTPLMVCFIVGFVRFCPDFVPSLSGFCTDLYDFVRICPDLSDFVRAGRVAAPLPAEAEDGGSKKFRFLSVQARLSSIIPDLSSLVLHHSSLIARVSVAAKPEDDFRPRPAPGSRAHDGPLFIRPPRLAAPRGLVTDSIAKERHFYPYIRISRLRWETTLCAGLVILASSRLSRMLYNYLDFFRKNKVSELFPLTKKDGQVRMRECHAPCDPLPTD